MCRGTGEASIVRLRKKSAPVRTGVGSARVWETRDFTEDRIGVPLGVGW